MYTQVLERILSRVTQVHWGGGESTKIPISPSFKSKSNNFQENLPDSEIVGTIYIFSMTCSIP